jgi:hypothetical protein
MGPGYFKFLSLLFIIMFCITGTTNANEDVDVHKTIAAAAGGNTAARTDNKNGYPPDDGSGCFIATAAYGSKDHPNVILLKKVRDIYLKKYELGRRFISAYYRFSPPVARFLQGHEMLRIASRAALFPTIIFSRLLIGFGGTPILLVFFIGYLFPFMIVLFMACNGKGHDKLERKL